MAAMKEAMRELLRIILRFVVRIIWHPKAVYVSETARQALLDGGCVVICNHVRGFDGAAIQTALGGRVHIWSLVAKDFVDEKASLRLILPVIRGIPVDRREASLSWLRESRKILRSGGNIYLCPEGKCSFDKVIRPFHEGFVLLAATAGAKVVPVYHNGCFPPVVGKRFRLIVGEPVSLTPAPEGTQKEIMREEADAMRTTMQGLEKRLNGFVKTETDAQGRESEGKP